MKRSASRRLAQATAPRPAIGPGPPVIGQPVQPERSLIRHGMGRIHHQSRPAGERHHHGLSDVETERCRRRRPSSEQVRSGCRTNPGDQRGWQSFTLTEFKLPRRLIHQEIPRTGLEPARASSLDPKSSASTNSAIPALFIFKQLRL